VGQENREVGFIYSRGVFGDRFLGTKKPLEEGGGQQESGERNGGAFIRELGLCIRLGAFMGGAIGPVCWMKWEGPAQWGGGWKKNVG